MVMPPEQPAFRPEVPAESRDASEILLLGAVNKMLREYEANLSSNHKAHLLQSVLDECLKHLPIELAILYFKEGNRLLYADSDSRGEHIHAPLLRLMRKDILAFDTNTIGAKLQLGRVDTELATTTATHHSEHSAVRNAPLDFPDLRDRLLVCIPDALGRIAGLLSLVRLKSSERPFSAAETCLIELLALPISKVVNAEYDTATGFLNESGFYPRFVELMRDNDSVNTDACLLQIRFGQLLAIGDGCGSGALDEAVAQLAAILEKRIRRRDLVARTGSSDFLLFLSKCSVKDAVALSEDLLDTLKGFRFAFKDKLFSINAFIGVAPLSYTADDPASVLEAAEDACAIAMQQGANAYSVYEPEKRVPVRSNGLINWPEKITRTLQDERLHLYSQPVVSLKHLERVDHYEILLRIKSDNALLIAPAVFIRAAERCRLIEQVDRWVVKTAFTLLDQIYSTNPQANEVLSINISGASLDDNFRQFVSELIQGMAFDSSAIIFEITEASAVSYMQQVVKTIRAMRQAGFRFSLEDFGSGMGSFAFLQNLAVDRLSIDAALLRGINRNEVNYAIVEALQLVSDRMSLQTTAKLVDEAGMLEKLRSIGVSFVQGHVIAKATPISHLLAAAAPAKIDGRNSG